MSDELRFVEELEREIGQLRKRAARSALTPAKDAPIVFSRRETKLLGRAAVALGHVSAEELVRSAVLSEVGRKLESVTGGIA